MARIYYASMTSSLERLQSSSLVKRNAGASVEAVQLVLEPHFGSIEWTHPASYAALLAKAALSVGREHVGMTFDM